MATFQTLIMDALKKSGHTVALVDRELRICWVTGMQRSVIGAPVNILWQGARGARSEVGKVLRALSSGCGCRSEYKCKGQRKADAGVARIDFIPLKDPAGEVEGFAAILQKMGTAAVGVADGVSEIYELLFELNSDGMSGLLRTEASP